MGTVDRNIYISIASNIYSYCINHSFYYVLYPSHAGNFTTFIGGI